MDYKDANRRNAERIADRLEKEKGIPRDITLDRLYDRPGWREREVEFMATQTKTSQEQIDKWREDVSQPEDELPHIRAMLLHKERGTGPYAPKPELEPEPGPKIPEGALDIGDGKYLTAEQVEKVKTETPEFHAVLVGDGYEAYRKAIEQHNKQVQLDRFVYQQDIKQSVELPDGGRIKYSTLQAIKETDPATYRVLTTMGIEAGREYVDKVNQEYDEFIENNTQLPDGAWIDNGKLDEIRANNRTAYEILTTGGFKEYRGKLDEAAETMDPWKSKRYPPTGEYELKRAMLRNKPEVKEAAGLLFGDDAVETIYKEYPHLRPGYPGPKRPPFDPQARGPVAPETSQFLGVKMSPPLIAAFASAGVVAVAEPTPVGEILLLVALGGAAAYGAYKASRGEKILPEVRNIVSEFKTDEGRMIDKRDISADLVVPSVLTFDLKPELAEQLKLKPGKLGIQDMPRGSPPGSIIRDLPRGSPPTTMIHDQETGVWTTVVLTDEEKAEIADIPSPQPLTKEEPLTIFKSATAVEVKAKEVTKTGIDFDKILEESLTKRAYQEYMTTNWKPYYDRAQQLSVLDTYMQDAYSRGEVDDEEYSDYRAARLRYLASLGMMEEALKQWVGGAYPEYKDLPAEDIATLAATYKQVFTQVKNAGATEAKAATQAQTAVRSMAQDMTESLEDTQTDAAERTQLKTKTQTATTTTTATAAQAQTATAAQAEAVDEYTMTDEATDTIRERTHIGETERTRTRTRTPKPIPLPGPQATDKEKRAYIESCTGAVGWIKGALRRDDKLVPQVHIVTEPYSRATHFTLDGDEVPSNVVLKKDAKEGYKVIISQLKGEPPRRPVRLEGGAVDPVISSKEGKVSIEHIYDASASRKKKEKEIGPGIVEHRKGGRRVRRVKS